MALRRVEPGGVLQPAEAAGCFDSSQNCAEHPELIARGPARFMGSPGCVLMEN